MAAPSRTAAEAVEHYPGRIVRLLSCVTSARTGCHAADRPDRLLRRGEQKASAGYTKLLLDRSDYVGGDH